jgi:class 3 adenylate cyclase
MDTHFTRALVEAQGRSEFVLVVVADIRGFSDFSTRNESPNIAMFIKRFYLQLLENYFGSANFVKPTGDGLLMTFGYSEQNLKPVVETVIRACMRCLAEFSTICKDDPMINFAVPQQIGFGIARGTACCLYSGEEILDYSGHLLNLASRLNDLARPSGIVIDGNFMRSVLPEDLLSAFGEQKVYLRGIAEAEPVNILYLNGHVEVPQSALSPLASDTWISKDYQYTLTALRTLGNYRVVMSPAAKSKDKIKITASFPKRGTKNIYTFVNVGDFTYSDTGPSALLVIDTAKLIARVIADKPAQNIKVKIRVEYVPKAIPRTQSAG